MNFWVLAVVTQSQGLPTEDELRHYEVGGMSLVILLSLFYLVDLCTFLLFPLDCGLLFQYCEPCEIKWVDMIMCMFCGRQLFSWPKNPKYCANKAYFGVDRGNFFKNSC